MDPVSPPWGLGPFTRPDGANPEFRGIRTTRYSFVRSIAGPWLLYDNDTDPYQLKNLVEDPSFLDLRNRLDMMLQVKLEEIKDEFCSGSHYLAKFGYLTNPDGAVPYRN